MHDDQLQDFFRTVDADKLVAKEQTAAMPVPEIKLYSTEMLTLLAFLCSPIVVGLMITINYRRLGKTLATVLSCLVSVIGMSVISLFVALGDRGFIGAITTNLTLQFVAGFAIQLQKQLLTNHERHKGQFESWSKARLFVGLVVVSMITISLILANTIVPRGE